MKDQVLETAISSTRTEWLNRAKLMFQLSRQKEGIDLNRVLQVVKCNQEVYIGFYSNLWVLTSKHHELGFFDFAQT